MTKSEFVDQVADRAELSKKDAANAVDAVLETIEGALRRGSDVTFSGFWDAATNPHVIFDLVGGEVVPNVAIYVNKTGNRRFVYALRSRRKRIGHSSSGSSATRTTAGAASRSV